MHPEILFYGELFNDTPQVREYEARRMTMGAGWKMDKPLDWGIDPCSYTESTHVYLDSFFNRDLPFKLAGFKILYHQVLSGPNSDAWRYIAAHPEIKIIRTQRENLIEVICSFVRASMTHRWHTTSDPIANKHRFVIPPHEFLTLLKRFEKVPEAMVGIEKTHKVLVLDYDRINADFSGCMADIYKFLDVDSHVVSTPRLKKIAGLKPDEELFNYKELKQHFQNTPYARYFIF